MHRRARLRFRDLINKRRDIELAIELSKEMEPAARASAACRLAEMS
jgi:hypothetical protein